MFVNVGEGGGVDGGSNGGQYRGSEYWRLVMKGCTGSRAVKLTLQEDYWRAHELSCLCAHTNVYGGACVRARMPLLVLAFPRPCPRLSVRARMRASKTSSSKSMTSVSVNGRASTLCACVHRF